MKFDVYGRFTLEVVREGEQWVAYELAPGKRVAQPDLTLPPEVAVEDLAEFLDDLFHELARPGQTIRVIT
ncbi:MAG: DUF7661 family protein [Burkholderiales bacterium]